MKDTRKRGPLDLGWEGVVGLVLGFVPAAAAFWGLLQIPTIDSSNVGAYIVAFFIVWVLAWTTIAWACHRLVYDRT